MCPSESGGYDSRGHIVIRVGSFSRSPSTALTLTVDRARRKCTEPIASGKRAALPEYGLAGGFLDRCTGPIGSTSQIANPRGSSCGLRIQIGLSANPPESRSGQSNGTLRYAVRVNRFASPSTSSCAYPESILLRF